jgi:outer membrane protein assembly factor BamD (BamD/ComL family)
MHPQKIGLTAFITLLATVSTSVTSYFPASFTPPRALAQTQDSRKASADKLFKEGIEQYQKHQLEAAIESWQQALTIYQQLQDRPGEKAALSGLGAAYLRAIKLQ